MAMRAWINAGTGEAYQEVNAISGAKYTCTVWTLRDSGALTGNFYIKLAWYQGATKISEDSQNVTVSNLAWNKQTLIAIAPQGANKLRVVLGSLNVNLTGKFDDAELTESRIYYVRPDGDDLNSGLENTPQGAFRTIQKAADIVNPFDIAEVQAGTYNEQVTITRSGASGQLITFHANGEVIIDGQNTRPYCIKLDGADYINIIGFTIRNATDNGILLDNAATYNIVSNNTCHNNGASGIRLNNTSHHNSISNNTCYSNGAGTSAYGDRPCGIYLFNYSHYNTLDGNTCRNNTSTGIWLEGNSSYCTVKNNKTYSNGWGGIIVVGGTNYNTVTYNLIYSNGAMGVDLSYSAHDNLFKNNTIYNNGSNGIQSNNNGYSNTLKNNIIFNNGLNNSYAYGISIETGSSATSIYNDIYNNGQGANRNYSGLSVGPGDISLDPLFKSTTSTDPNFLKLKSLAGGDSVESPCIDSGSPSDTPSVQSGKRIDIGAFDLYQHSPIQGGLTAEYFDNQDLTSLKLTRIDPRINFDWGSATPDASLGVDTFSVRWQGLVKIDYTQNYTFYITTDDGSRLYIDNKLIIDKWVDQGPTEHSATIALTPGLHDIKYEYYENGGGAVAKLYWSAPSINKSLIPQDHLYYFGALPQDKYIQGGLKGTYSKFTNITSPTSYVFTRIDPQINFDWGYNMPDSALGQDLYQAKWKGKIRIPATDTYTFYATTDDGVKLWVNNQLVVDNWRDQGATERSGSIYLSPGLYDIELNYYENGGLAVCKLLWSSSTITKQVIPSAFLYYKNDLIIEEGGLYAEYFDNKDLTNPKIKRIDPNIDLDWLSASPDKLIEPDTFSIRWTGQVKADYNETYTFYANSDDGLKLWVDGFLLINTWFDHGAYEISAPITLTAGWHDIKVEYYENAGLSSAKLAYSSASTPKTIIPQDHLRTTLSAEDATLNFYSSLNSAQDVQTPYTGHSGSIIQSGTGQVTFEWAKFGKGALLNGTTDGTNDELISFSSGDLNKKEGTIEFWFKPNWDSNDDITRHLFTTTWNWDGCIQVFKYFNNSLYFKIVKEGVQHAIVSNTARMWNAGEWHHLAFSYGPQGMKFYLDYNLTIAKEIPISWTFHGELPYTGPLPDTFASDLYLGGADWGGEPSDAIFDEVKIYNKQIVPSDTKAPVFTITSHQNNQVVNSSPVTIAGKIDDNLATVTVTVNNGPPYTATVSSGTFSASIDLVSGPNSIMVKAEDQSSNESTQEITLILNNPPIITNVTPPSGSIFLAGSNINIEITASDQDGDVLNYQFKIDGAVKQSWSSSSSYLWSTGPSDGGTHTITCQVKDDHGGEASRGVTYEIILDVTPPTGTIKINNDGQYTNSRDVTLNLSATDTQTGVSQMRFSNDGSNWSDPEPYAIERQHWTLEAGDATKTVYAQFKDGAGNWSAPNAIKDTIILDTQAPAVVISLPANGSISRVPFITVEGTIDDDSATVKVNNIDAPVSNGTFRAEGVPLNPSGQGTIITATATDLAGNPSVSNSITVTFDPNFIPTEIFEDFDGNNKRVNLWWNGFDGEVVYKRSLDHTIFRGGSTSMKVEYNKSGRPWSFFAVEPKRNGVDNNFSKYDKFSFWVWTQDANLTIRVKFEDNNGHTWERDLSSVVQGSWQRLIYDFSDASQSMDLTNVYNILFFVAPGQTSASGTFYIDDLSLHCSKPYTYPPLSKPVLTGPAEPVYGDYQLNWTEIAGATIYELCESDTPAFETPRYYWSNSAYIDFTDRIQMGTYYYKVRAWSNVPEENGTSGPWSDYITVEVTDGPPVISEVWSAVGADSDNEYPTGSYVKICLKEKYNAPDIVSGTIRVTSSSQSYDSGLLAVTKSQDGSYYFYHWDTNGLNPANDYIATTTLTDAIGQTDTDGSDQDPDLTLTLILENPPRYADNLETDFFIPARGMPIKFERYYLNDMKHDSPIGYNWTHNYYMRISEVEDGNVQLWDERDVWNFFTKNPDGSYNSPPGKHYTLIRNPDNTFTFKKPDNITYNFNSDNKLGSIRDLNGNQVTLNYSNGLLSTVTDTSDRVITFDYYANGKIKTITDFTGRTFNYEYDSNGNLIKYTNPAGYVTTYEYEGDHLLSTITNPRGYHTYFTYVGDKLLSNSNDNGINYASYTSETNPSKMIITNARGYKTTYISEDTIHSSIVDALGNITTTITDNQHNPISITDANGNTSNYTWDEYGNKLSETDPYGKRTTYTYEPRYHKIKSQTDANDNSTIYYYDYEEATLGDLNYDGVTNQDKGNLIAIKYPYDKAITVIYDQYGQIIQTTDENGNITKYEYNNSTGTVTKITRQMGDAPDPDIDLIITMQYDPRGNLENLTNPRGFTATFDYDILNQLTLTTDALGNKVEYKYDENGNVKEIIYKDANDVILQTVTKAYDEVDRLWTITDNSGNTTTYEYDKNGNLIKVTDAKGNFTSYAYDERDLLCLKTDDLGNPTIYDYWPIGKLKSLKDAKGNITAHYYDDANRIQTVRYPDLSEESYEEYDNVGNLLKKINRAGELISYAYDNLNRLTTKTYPDTSTVTYSYDDGSRLLSVTDSNGTITYSYDRADCLTSVTDVYNKVVSYEYDKASNRTKLIYPDGTYITYVYDALNRLEHIKNPSGADIAAYDYDDLSRRTSLTLENGTQTIYAYDNINRLTNLVNKKITPERILSSFGYTLYDNVGNNLTKVTQEGPFSYAYNDIYELEQVTDPQENVTAYNYDGVNNRTTAEGQSYAVNELNQYITVGSTSYTYDLKGNLTGDGTWTYTYDYENRLISATDGTTEAAYAYDYSGRRIAKTVGGVTTRYIYDNTDIIAEYDTSNNLLHKNIFGGRVDEVLKRTDYTGTSALDYYYHKDRLGSTVTITDSSADIVEKYFYDAYGNAIIKDSNNNVLSQSAINNRYLYTGREYDQETGLYYYRARMYSSKIGRFLQPDPIGYYDSENLYQYCLNDPINTTDPYGLCNPKWITRSFGYEWKISTVELSSSPWILMEVNLTKVTGKIKLGKWIEITELWLKIYQSFDYKRTTYKLWKWEYQLLIDDKGKVLDSRTVWKDTGQTKVEEKMRIRSKNEYVVKVKLFELIDIDLKKLGLESGVPDWRGW